MGREESLKLAGVMGGALRLTERLEILKSGIRHLALRMGAFPRDAAVQQGRLSDARCPISRFHDHRKVWPHPPSFPYASARMSALGLDPEQVAARVRALAVPPRIPSLGWSVGMGSMGFAGVSLLVFGLWASSGKWLQQQAGELGFYLVCAGVFINVAAWWLRRLLINGEDFARFYMVFALAFGAYAIAWCVCWFALRGRAGEWAGSLAGTVVLGIILGRAFGAPKATLPVVVVLFTLHSLGYFLGSWLYSTVGGQTGARLFGDWLEAPARATAAKLLWGAAYGLGMGAGLGFALHACQQPVRERLIVGK